MAAAVEAEEFAALPGRRQMQGKTFRGVRIQVGQGRHSEKSGSSRGEGFIFSQEENLCGPYCKLPVEER